jgi:hypothetical protein
MNLKAASLQISNQNLLAGLLPHLPIKRQLPKLEKLNVTQTKRKFNI